MSKMKGSQYSICLYTRASQIDHVSNEADIFCHRELMLLEIFNLRRFVEDFPVDYLTFGNVVKSFPHKKFPTLAVYRGEINVDNPVMTIENDVDEIEAFLLCCYNYFKDATEDDIGETSNTVLPMLIEVFEKKSKNDRMKLPETLEVLPQMTKEDRDVANRVNTSSMYAKFFQYIKNSPGTKDSASEDMLKANLNAELRSLNSFLLSQKDKDRPFFNGKEPGLLDCNMLPKLHCIDVALRRGNVKPFEFKENEVCAIMEYLERGRELDAFKHTQPKDADIVSFYCRKAGYDSRVVNEKVARVQQCECPQQQVS